jgi:iron complex transport system substrate-binding protein
MIGKCTALLAAALLLAGCRDSSHLRKCEKNSGFRVIAMAPSTAEILYALGLSNEVVGVSRFTAYPPDVTNKPTVGGLYDPNWEMIVALQPTLVIGLNTQKEIEAQLKQLGIGFLGVSHEHVSEIMQSILTIGEACGAEEKARQLFQGLELTSSGLAVSSNGWRPKVLVCVGHDDAMTRLYVAAKDTFYDELIRLAGGVNACTETAQKYPEISPEGLAVMNPDLVIDIFPNPGSRLSLDDFSNAWKPYRAIPMTNSYAFTPGPRFTLLLEDFAKAIHE